jgi:hypothetical protein
MAFEERLATYLDRRQRPRPHRYAKRCGRVLPVGSARLRCHVATMEHVLLEAGSLVSFMVTGVLCGWIIVNQSDQSNSDGFLRSQWSGFGSAARLLPGPSPAPPPASLREALRAGLPVGSARCRCHIATMGRVLSEAGSLVSFMVTGVLSGRIIVNQSDQSNLEHFFWRS